MSPLERSLMTISCQDANSIPKNIHAGRIILENELSIQIMHNGLKVIAGGYHGDWMAHIIRSLKGHHEPQEELIFYHLLKYIQHYSLIIELGSFWSYYTQWFLLEIPNSNAICVEPDIDNLKIGRINTKINGNDNRVQFFNAWIGGETQKEIFLPTETSSQIRGLPVYDMDDLLKICGEQSIELLHMDTQGAELAFIQSMRQAVGNKRVRFIMVSTHHSSISGSKTTHEDCIATIKSLGGFILVEHDIIESFSGDGLILASFMDSDRSLYFPEISRNKAETSLFKSA